MSLSGSIALQIQGVLSSSRDLGSASVGETLASRITITDGAGANQATQAWGDTRTLAAATAEDLDLSGSLTNGLGSTVTLTRIMALMITAASANPSTITIGDAAANAWEGWCAAGSTVSLRPGGCMILVAPDAAGYVVTAGTGDLLQVENDDADDPATYSILILGSQA